MKKTFISNAFAFVALFAFASGTAFAQSPQVALPSAGLTPESNFYFLDKFGEAFREFFTFNPDGKAHLRITFAAERIAEIKVILETKGVEAQGLEVAQSRLQAHLANASNNSCGPKSRWQGCKPACQRIGRRVRCPENSSGASTQSGEAHSRSSRGGVKSKNPS